MAVTDSGRSEYRVPDGAFPLNKCFRYFTGFTSGWKTFTLLNAHLHPSSSEHDLRMRREEVKLLIGALVYKPDRGRLWSENIILIGDFNFYDGPTRDDPTVKLLRNAGFREVDSLVGTDTNAFKSQAYDRVFLVSDEYFTLG